MKNDSENISTLPFDKHLSSIIDHTILSPNATEEQIRKECRIAAAYEFASIIVNTYNISIAVQELQNSNVMIGCAISFPFGAESPLIKALQARDAVAAGADELDMVINIGALKSGRVSILEREIDAVVQASSPHPVKVVIETAYLTDKEKIKACKIAMKMGAAFVKTSTGYAPMGATIKDIKLMRNVVGPHFGVKAAGGIRTKDFALKLIEAGANRLGLSRSVDIVTGKA